MTETSGYDDAAARPEEPATESGADASVDEETGLPARGASDGEKTDPEVEPG